MTGSRVVCTVNAGKVIGGTVVVTCNVVSSIVVMVPGGIDDSEIETSVNVTTAVAVAVAVS